ncbi:MAG: efflux RND transporter permease subunit, partial [Lautropia mirabilis]|nr:efflux RND transporter permease subunit [Lautropia mirabilis]
MAKFFIYRPVFAWVVALFLMVLGVVSITQLPVSQYPNVAPPTIRISTTYPGASAQTLEDSVLSIIEREMNGSPGLMYMESVAQADGTGTLSLTFENGTNEDLAQVDVQNRLSRATPRLPSAVTQQGVQIEKARSNFLTFVMLSSNDPSLDTIGMGDYASRNILPEIQRIEGVGQARLFGAERAMRIWLDPAKLESYKLSSANVVSAIQGQNIQVSAGATGALPNPGGTPITANVNVKGQLSTVEEFGNIVLRTTSSGAAVRLKDVARIELGGQSYATTARINGKPATGIGVSLSNTGNALSTARAVHAKMKELQQFFPQSMEWQVPYDTSDFVDISIEQVVHTLGEA